MSSARSVATFRMAFIALCLMAAAVSWAAGGQDGGARPGVARISESALRRLSVDAPLPPFPAASLKRGTTGVAVIAVVVNGERVEATAILEAPDGETGTAAAATVSRWRFTPASVGKVSGKLTFYFRIRNGTGVVEAPNETAAKDTRAERPSTTAGRVVPLAKSDATEAVTEAQLQRLARTAKIAIIDVRDRVAFRQRHRSDSRNMPTDELSSRARAELGDAAVIVVDCSYSPATECRIAAAILMEEGFGRVAILKP